MSDPTCTVQWRLATDPFGEWKIAYAGPNLGHAVVKARAVYRRCAVQGTHTRLAIRVLLGDTVLYTEDSEEVYAPSMDLSALFHSLAAPEAESADQTPLLRAADGVDAGAYTISAPLTVEEVRRRRQRNDELAETSPTAPDPATEADLTRLFADVLHAIAAERHTPAAALARAALGLDGTDQIIAPAGTPVADQEAP